MCSWRLGLFSYGWTVLSDSRKKKPNVFTTFRSKILYKKALSQPFHSLSLNQIIKSKRTSERHAKKYIEGALMTEAFL